MDYKNYSGNTMHNQSSVNTRGGSHYTTRMYNVQEYQNLPEYPRFNVPPPNIAPNEFVHQFPPYPVRFPFPSPPVNYPVPPFFGFPPRSHFQSQVASIPSNLPVSAMCATIDSNSHLKEPIDNILAALSTKKIHNFSIKLYEISKYFQKFYLLLRNLENDTKYLSSCYEKSSTEEWDIFCGSIVRQQESLLAHKNSLTFDGPFLYHLKHKINKRKKKRKLSKEMKRSRQKTATVYEVSSLYMQQSLQAVEQIKQEEKLKQEADNILSSVLHKKNDANYHIQLLTALLKLHSARTQALNVENKYFANSSINSFKKVVGTLKNLWENQLEEYTIEESGLKIMLNELAVTAEDEDYKNLKKIFNKWLKFIFGTTDLKEGLFYSGYDEFTDIRRDWDKYVVEDEIHSSKIPPGWIIPKCSNNRAWTKFITE